MKTRGLPGMLAPRYQELARTKRVVSATSLTWATQDFLGLGIGFRRRHTSFAHPGYEVGDEVDVLLDADGHVAEDGGAAGGAVIMNMLGKPATCRPR